MRRVAIFGLTALLLAEASLGAPAQPGGRRQTTTTANTPRGGVWGSLATLDNTYWFGAGKVLSFRWIVPHQTMEIITSQGDAYAREVLELTSDGSSIDGLIEWNNQRTRWTMPRQGLIIQEIGQSAERTVYQFEAGRLSKRQANLLGGQWQWKGDPVNYAPMTENEANAKIAELKKAVIDYYSAQARYYEQSTAQINAEIAARQAANSEPDTPQQPMGAQLLSELQSMAGEVQQQNRQQQADFDRRMQRDTQVSRSSNYPSAKSSPVPGLTSPPVIRQSPPPMVAGGTLSSSSSVPRMCTTPGGTRTWSTGMMTPLADARADYEAEARNIRGRGGSAGPMQCSKGVTSFGVTSAVCTATFSYPAKTTPCGARVSPQ